MAEAIVFALPQIPGPDPRQTHWWHIAGGAIVESGFGAQWLQLGSNGKAVTRIALAPATVVRVAFSDSPPAATPRQASAIARSAEIDASIGDADDLHAVSASLEAGDRVPTAVVDKKHMLAWLDWARQLGAEPNHVVPVAALLPWSDVWTEATFGSERIVGRRDLVLPFEPQLADRIVGDAPVEALADADVGAALVAAAERPPLDLRAGRFAKRRRIALERARIRELVLLAALVPLITLASSLVSILKLESSTDRLDAQTIETAEAALGRPVTMETAEAELAQSLGARAHGGLMPLITALYQALQAEEGVSATEISYRADGTLSVSLAAPSVDGINRLLIALQRDNYRITAVPRQAPDGRSIVDATVRSGP